MNPMFPFPVGLTLIVGRPGLGKTQALFSLAEDAPVGSVFAPGDEGQACCQSRLRRIAPNTSLEVLDDDLDMTKLGDRSLVLVDGLAQRPWGSVMIKDAIQRLSELPCPAVLTVAARAVPAWAPEVAKEAWLMTAVHTVECQWSPLPSRKGQRFNVSYIVEKLFPRPESAYADSQVPSESRKSV